MWESYNPNPTGREVGDCAVRAIAKALDTDWETAYAMLTLKGFLVGDMPSSNSVIGSVLRQHGFTRHAVSGDCPDCYTIEEFAKENPEGTYVAFTGNHVCTIRNGAVFDSWDSRQEIPQFYWEKEGE